MKTRFLLTYIALLLAFTSKAQHTLHGHVTGVNNNAALSGATVFIPELKKLTITDSTGSFQFEGLPASLLRLQVSMIGYTTKIYTVDPAESLPELSISLETSNTELNEVLVTTSNTREVHEIPAPAFTVSQEELRSYAQPTFMQNLAYKPGIDRISIGNGIGKPVIRGLSFNQVMLYSQGTRIENQQWDDHHDLGLSDAGIQNVEIVRGPAALLYGADALGGALILVDEKPVPAGKILGDASIALHTNTMGGNGDVGIKGAENSGLFYSFRAGGTLHTSYLQGENGRHDTLEDFAANSKFKSYAGKATVGLSKKWGISKLTYSVHQQAIGIIEDESGSTKPKEEEANEQREYEVEAPYQDVNTQIISLENTLISGKSKIKLNLAYQSNYRQEFEPRTSGKGKDLAIGLDLKVSTFDARWISDESKPLGFTVGAQGTMLENENFGNESLVPDAESATMAGFGIIRYDINKFNFMAGIRVDHQELELESYESFNESDILITDYNTGDTLYEPEIDVERSFDPFSFSIGTAWNATEKLTLKLNAATGFTAPNYHQLAAFGKHEGTYRFEIGDSNLDMIQNLETDLGIFWQSKEFSFGAEAYVNMLQDYIYLENTGDSVRRVKTDTTLLPVYKYKQNDATMTGFEITAGYYPSAIEWLDLNVGYAYVRGELDKGGYLPYIPSNKLTGEIRLSKNKLGLLLNSFVSVRVSNYQKQKHVTEFEMSTDGYTLVDLQVGTGFRLGKQEAQVSIFCTNLTDQAYYNQLSLVKEINIRDMGREYWDTV